MKTLKRPGGIIMNPEFTKKLDLLASNRKALNGAFVMEMGMSMVVGSLILAGAGKEADIVKMKEARKILKKKAPVFSAFRDSIELVVVSRMTLADDPERYFVDLVEVYNMLKKGRIMEDSYYILSAMIICDRNRKDQAEDICARTDEIMRRMSKEHPLLTSSEDLAMAVLLAMTDRDVDRIIADMEECFTYIKKELKIKAEANSLQSLTQLLALSEGNMKAKCDKVADLFRSFRDHGMKYGTYLEFPALATIIDVDVPTDELVGEICEAAEYLKKNKGFSNWNMDSKSRLMFATLVASDVYSKDKDSSEGVVNKAVVMNSTLAMAIAEEVAILVIMLCVMTTNNN